MIDEEFLKKEIKRDEKIEEELAVTFGMTGDIDDTKVVDAAMQLAAQTEEDLQRIRAKIQTLHKLRRNRTELAGLNKPPHRVDGRRFWVVLIGIDKYAGDDVLNLKGCVRDALEMRTLLHETLQVPFGRMCLLLSPLDGDDSTAGLKPNTYRSPTREHIISALTDLISNHDIMKNDGIIVYYAGHGTAYTVTDDTQYTVNGVEVSAPNLGFVEALCPLDRRGDDPVIPDISGRELNIILEKISLEKGPDITVILDSCYSGTVTTPVTGSAAERYALPLMAGRSSPTPLSAMMVAADTSFQLYADPKKPEEQSVWTAKWSANKASHVLLTACKTYQSASELGAKFGNRGLFTDALVRALKSSEVQAGCSFVGLLRAMPSWKNRTPVVVGDRKHSPLWFRQPLRPPNPGTLS
ncbi:caspase domain-containing protein [Armillaria borealis]|uniref:Caspase domain-containing protein n=1 Tax=Armillaria borealis TaxID=47425 RepID=A0AA39JNZ9_9AGAR|nr:caspase domain-containing protein [Armillaria borealis]